MTVSSFLVPDELVNEGAAVEPVGPKSLYHKVELALRLATRRWLAPADLPETVREEVRKVSRSRFATPETVKEALKRYVPPHGGEAAEAELRRLKSLCEGYNPVPAYRLLLKQSGRTPEQIVRWVRESTLHVDGWPAVMKEKEKEKERERAFTPLETAFSGIGQCTGAAALAAALIETAGFRTRQLAVPGHTFFEWQSPRGRWQLEDVDLFPPEIALPRGLSMRSLLENHGDWTPILNALPTMNVIAPSHCFVPTGGGPVFLWRHVLQEPQRYDFQKNFDIGSIPRQTRKLHVEAEVADGNARLLADNPNPNDLLLLVCDRPFEDEAPPKLDEIGKQHDVFRFARARGYYDQHMEQVQKVLCALVPAGAKRFPITLSGLEAGDVSVFTRPTGSVAADPYLIASRLTLKASGESPVRGEPAPTEVPPSLRTAQAVFSKLCEQKDSGLSDAAIRYAQGTGPERAFQAVRRQALPSFPGRVLDAGCGTGEYAFVLAEHAQSVAAIDYTAERVAFLEAALRHIEPRPNIDAATGSIEKLPYGDGEFDAVFCRGVIFLTNLPRTLAEFHRVLKPGGQVYIDCNADAWNSYLMLERGKTSPDAARQGRDTLYNTVWRRHAAQAIPILERSISRLGLQTQPKGDPSHLDDLLDELSRHLSAMSSEDAATVRRLELNARRLCGEAFLPVILSDMLAVAAGRQSGPTVTVGSQAWQPEEVAEVAARLGFTGFEWWSEAGSRRTAGLRPLEIGPQLQIRGNTAREHFRGDLSVWHALFGKPLAT